MVIGRKCDKEDEIDGVVRLRRRIDTIGRENSTSTSKSTSQIREKSP